MITASRIENEPYWIDGMSYSVQDTTSIDNRNIESKLCSKQNQHQHNRRKTEDSQLLLKSPKSYLSDASKLNNTMHLMLNNN